MPAKLKIPPELLAEVRAVYDELASRPMDRNCQLRTECCHFKKTGRTPHLTQGEALVAAKALRAAGRKEMPVSQDGACPMLDPRSMRCMIYEGRPFGCRTHFCAAAGGMLPRHSVVDLIRRLENVDAQLGGTGSRELPGAVSDALAALR
jgi:Fe-S-cluster containining protein